MRRLVVPLLLVVFAVSASAAPREEPRSRDREVGNPVLKVVKRVIRALGDGLTVPTRP